MAKTALPPSLPHEMTRGVKESTPVRSSESRTESIYRPDPRFGSVVSFPNRCPEWGDASFRGNCDGTLFKELVLKLRPKSVADPMMGSGTTKDVIDGLNAHARDEITFWGGDLRTGFDLGRCALPGTFDLVWVHPPYWDIVRYSEDPRDLSSTAEWADFCLRLAGCLLRCVRALRPGGHLAVLVGDIRKQGHYYSMAAEVLSHRGAFGKLHSVIIKVQHNCASDRKRYPSFSGIPIRHEYCLLFQKEAG